MTEMRELTSGDPEGISVGKAEIEASSPDLMELITDTKELFSCTLVGSAVIDELIGRLDERLTGTLSGRLDCSLTGRLDERPGCELTG